MLQRARTEFAGDRFRKGVGQVSLGLTTARGFASDPIVGTCACALAGCDSFSARSMLSVLELWSTCFAVAPSARSAALLKLGSVTCNFAKVVCLFIVVFDIFAVGASAHGRRKDSTRLAGGSAGFVGVDYGPRLSIRPDRGHVCVCALSGGFRFVLTSTLHARN